MEAHQEAILKSLVAVAWADGRVQNQESELIDAFLASFEVSDDDSAVIREFAREKKTLDDIQTESLGDSDRRLLLQHAVLVTYIDGEQTDQERALLDDLAKRLEIPPAEATSLLEVFNTHAQTPLAFL